ncbi:MAG: hypothetical protein PUE46_00845 [Eubacteriales bacterium]|nr:hypothetical protein [Eubacteriales bacterium]
MLKALLKKQMTELNKGFLQNKKTGELRSKKSAVGIITMFALLMCFIAFAFVGIGELLMASLHPVGLDWLYFFIMLLMSIMLGAFGSVFNTYTSLFKAGDNDLLFSMPIKPGMIITVRLVGVYLMGLMYCLPVAIPAVGVYWFRVGVTLLTVLLPLLSIVVMSFFILVLSIVVGYVVAILSTKIKNKTFVSVFCSVLFLVVYYFAYFKANELIRTIAENPDYYGKKIKSSTFFLYNLANGACGNVGSFFISFGITAVAFGIVIFVLCKNFMSIASKSSYVKSKKVKQAKIKASSLKSALLKKELKRFSTSTAYMMNCGLGLIIMPIVAILAFIKQDFLGGMMTEISAESQYFSNMMFLAPVSAMCMICTLNGISSPSISLEGKNLWVLQSLPVSEKAVLEAKVNVHVLLNSIPAVISTAIMCVAFGLDILNIILSCCIVWMYIWFDARLGLILNLKHNNLEWTNEVVPIKQGVSVLFNMLIGTVISIAMLAISSLALTVLNSAVYMAIFVAVFILLNLVEMRWLNKKGVEIFKSL